MNKNEIISFIKKQKVVIVSSIDENGNPNIKAMFKPRKMEDNGVFYFSTNTSSKRVSHFRNNPQSCLYFFHKGIIRCTGIMLIGTMEVLENQEVKEKFWKPTDKLYYRKGVTDPDYCILKFTAKTGRYYRDLKTDSFAISD